LMFRLAAIETPFSTVKAWVVVPADQRRVSERRSSSEIVMRAKVKELPVLVRVRYVGFVLAGNCMLVGG